MVNKGQTLMNPRLENLLTKVASKFTLVSLAAAAGAVTSMVQDVVRRRRGSPSP